MRESLEPLRALRAVRHYRPDPVPRESVERIVEAARWTGSARNRQPWRFVAVTDAALRVELSRCGAYAVHLAAAPVVLVLASVANEFSDTLFDMGRVAQSVCLAARELGLGSCPTTFHPAENVSRVAALLGLPDAWLPRHAVAMGYPAAAPSPSAVPTGRLSTAELLRWV
ncbi:nitroreductase family protein [Nocardia otitidiscaviarum]|uniref:nitroreductase family protein n=1 Tax=Nocardia otitidiscaviarum TaxID=1823 RepID=UPI0018945BC6|nr:nitroreductase family protein [Nocardia otitidiscaviarum]MBF6240565.1 nitroreductase family protein [Nocardia otitidiscaviarum]